MTVLGYKYNTEAEAQLARKQCADYKGIIESPFNETKYWVDYYTAIKDTPVFWYIEYLDELEEVLGQPYEFEIANTFE